MQNITSYEELENAIQRLEAELSANKHAFKEQFFITLDSLKPIRIIESTLKEIATSPSVTNSVLGTTIGMATGYLSKKIAVGKSDNVVRKLLGSFLQLGITNIIAQNPETIKAMGLYVINKIFNKKDSTKKQSEQTNS